MKAWNLHGVNDFKYEEVKKPVPVVGEVLVAVKAVGTCGSDIPRVYENGTYSFPTIIGHEFSGVVEEIGADVEPEWKNKRVGVFPLIPCKNCVPCKNKKYEMCRKYSYIGSRRDGAFAEYVTVPAENLIELPEGVSYEEAAMFEPMAVAVHAMRRVNPIADDTVAICGVGTIGTLLLMFLMEAGIKNILVIGNKEFQKQTVLKLGLPEECYCDSKTQEVNKWVMECTDGRGVDVFFECVGRNETLSQVVDLAAPSGRVCLVGNPFTDMKLDRDVYWKILRNQLMVTGTWNSSFTHEVDDDWHYVLDRLAEKKIAPAKLISHRYALKDVVQGFEIMRDKTEDYIKVMACVDSI